MTLVNHKMAIKLTFSCWHRWARSSSLRYRRAWHQVWSCPAAGHHCSQTDCPALTGSSTDSGHRKHSQYSRQTVRPSSAGSSLWGGPEVWASWSYLSSTRASHRRIRCARAVCLDVCPWPGNVGNVSFKKIPVLALWRVETPNGVYQTLLNVNSVINKPLLLYHLNESLP